MSALRASLSCITSSQFGISARSLFSKATFRSCVPPGVLVFPSGLHLNTCFWMRCSGILCKWLTHSSLFSLSWCCTVCFQFPFGSLCLGSYAGGLDLHSMSQGHLIWKVINFLMFFMVTGQVSARYNRVDIIRVWNIRILVCLLRLWL